MESTGRKCQRQQPRVARRYARSRQQSRMVKREVLLNPLPEWSARVVRARPRGRVQTPVVRSKRGQQKTLPVEIEHKRQNNRKTRKGELKVCYNHKISALSCMEIEGRSAIIGGLYAACSDA